MKLQIFVPQKKPERKLAMKRVGSTLSISDGEQTIELPMRARPIAEDVQKRIDFWHGVDPSLTTEQLIVKALHEHDCAVAAQRRRRFGRVFGGG